jgi:hypothetical protein
MPLGGMSWGRGGVSGLCGWQLRSRPSGPKRGVLCFHALGDNVFADSLNSRFIHSTCAAHRVEIRPRLITFKFDLGTRDGAAMHHQINPLVAHIAILSPHRAGSELRVGQGTCGCWPRRFYCHLVSFNKSSLAWASTISRQIVGR